VYAGLLDPLRQRLEVLALGSGTPSHVRTLEGGGKVRVEPFDAIELGVVWG
jgi:hypothetical protein